MTRKLRVILYWHMHQPSYNDPISGSSTMPWVRLHAMKDYADMGGIVEEVPGAKAVFNFVPSLWDQIEQISNGEWLDDHEIITRKREEELSEKDKLFIAEHFFNCPFDTMIDPLPHYRELYFRFGSGIDQKLILQAGPETIRDILVWFHLAWCGHMLRSNPFVENLLKNGSSFTSEEKYKLLDITREFIGDIPSYYKDLSERGIVEISATPYYHPILPILLDPESPLVACPGMALPNGRASLAQDAAEQVSRAIDRHKKLFGSEPQGFWPAEGSVSPKAADLFSSLGVKWIATDEEVLRLSLNKPKLTSQEKFQPYRFSNTNMFFRDHGLSDRIGFVYQRMPAEKAAKDFISLLHSIHASLDDENDYVVPVILDGENCWEFYKDQGRPFLLELYGKLVEDPDIELTTFSECLSQIDHIPELKRLHSGSWIDANFTTWIGDPVKNKAWGYLYEARKQVDLSLSEGAVPDPKRAELLEQVYAAEGSDWFWWFGEGHSTSYDIHFDHLFRRRLQKIYKLLDSEAPDYLSHPVDDRWEDSKSYILPAYRIMPEIDGKSGSYFEWLSAGVCYPQGGAMQRSDGIFKKLLFGFDENYLYLRIDGPSFEKLSSNELTTLIDFHAPEKRSFEIPFAIKVNSVEQETIAFRFAFDQCLEAAIPFKEIGPTLKAGDMIEFSVSLTEEGREVERLPDGAPISMPFPSETFDDENWLI